MVGRIEVEGSSLPAERIVAAVEGSQMELVEAGRRGRLPVERIAGLVGSLERRQMGDLVQRVEGMALVQLAVWRRRVILELVEEMALVQLAVSRRRVILELVEVRTRLGEGTDMLLGIAVVEQQPRKLVVAVEIRIGSHQTEKQLQWCWEVMPSCRPFQLGWVVARLGILAEDLEGDALLIEAGMLAQLAFAIRTPLCKCSHRTYRILLESPQC